VAWHCIGEGVGVLEIVEHVTLLIDRIQDEFEELTERLLVSMALKALVCHREVDIRKVHTDRLVREVFHELLKEGEGDAIAILQVDLTSSLRLEFAEVQGVHVARDPEVAQDLLLWTQVLGRHL